MVWFLSSLLAFFLATSPGGASTHPDLPKRLTAPDGVTATCDDFVKVTDDVFTGRTGAYFTAGGTREYLGGDTFGPNALRIGGVDPALYLQHKCAPDPTPPG